MVKVLDFGIAKVKEARMGDSAGMTLTGTGVVIGTPQYMSPEQAMGKRGDELDGRADLYSLGIVMYQMLTADLPFKADTTMEMLLAHMQKPPAPISLAHPELGVPEPVAALTMRLLEKNRDMRPASARGLIQEIEKAEKEMATVGKTRIVSAEEMRAGSDQAAGGVIPQRPQPAPVRPIEPARVAPRPQPPPPPHAAPRPRPSESRWGMWMALVVLILGLGGGGLYIVTRQPVSTPSRGVETPTSQQPVEQPQRPRETTTPVSQPTTPSEQPATQLTSPNTTEHTEAEPVAPVRNTPRSNPHKATRVVEVAPPKPAQPVQPAVDPAKIRSWITQGDFFLKRGEYDSAINAYEQGLNLDPTNQDLREKLDKTRKARDIERKILQQ
jgi:serine/threonine protein kinase